MGALAKALWRNNNLQPVAGALQGYLQQRQYNRDLQQLAQYQKDYEQGLNTAIQPKQQTVTQNVETPIMRQENTDNKPFKVGLGTLPGAGISPLQKLTNSQYLPELAPAGTKTLPVTTTEEVSLSPLEQKRAINDQVLKYTNNVFALQGLTPEMRNNALSLAQLKANNYMPQAPQMQTLGAGDRLISIDEGGNITELANNPKPEVEKNPVNLWHTVGDNVRSKDRHRVVTERNIVTGETRETDLGQTYEKPEKEKETGTLDLHDLMGKVKSDIANKKYYAANYDSTDANGAPTTEGKKMAELESQIQGNTDALVEAVDSSYPGFLDYISKGWTYKKGAARDKYIQDISIPEEAKKYMRFYFDSRDRQ